jgi:hypothetical protein
MCSPQTVRCFVLFQIQNRAKRFDLPSKRRERSKLHFGSFIQKRDRTVCCAEIKADSIHGILHCLHQLYYFADWQSVPGLSGTLTARK